MQTLNILSAVKNKQPLGNQEEKTCLKNYDKSKKVAIKEVNK